MRYIPSTGKGDRDNAGDLHAVLWAYESSGLAARLESSCSVISRGSRVAPAPKLWKITMTENLKAAADKLDAAALSAAQELAEADHLPLQAAYAALVREFGERV